MNEAWSAQPIIQTPILPRTNNADHRLPKFKKILTRQPQPHGLQTSAITVTNLTAAAGLIVSDGATTAAEIISDKTCDSYLNTKLIHDPDIYVDWKKVNRVRKMMSSSTKVMAAVAAGRNP
jgi:hypothetical protein